MKIQGWYILIFFALIACSGDASDNSKDVNQKEESQSVAPPVQKDPVVVSDGQPYRDSTAFYRALRKLHKTNYMHDIGNIQCRVIYIGADGNRSDDFVNIVPYALDVYSMFDQIYILPYFFKFQKNVWGQPEFRNIGEVRCNSIELKLNFENLPCKEFILFQRNPAEKIYAVAAKHTTIGPFAHDDSEYTMFFPKDYGSLGAFIYPQTIDVGSWDMEQGLINLIGRIEVMNTAFVEM